MDNFERKTAVRMNSLESAQGNSRRFANRQPTAPMASGQVAPLAENAEERLSRDLLLRKRGTWWHLRGKVRVVGACGPVRSIDVTGALGTQDEVMARAEAVRIIELAKAGHDPRAERATFAKLAKQWTLPENISDEWALRLNGILKRHLVPYFGALRAYEIPAQVFAYKAERESAGASKSSLMKELHCLQCVVRQALPEFRIDFKAMTFRKHAQPKDLLIDEATLRVLVAADANRASDGDAGDLMTLMFYTGFRLADAVTLNAEAIDFDRRTIAIFPCKTRRSSAKRVVTPMLDPVVDVVRGRMAESETRGGALFGVVPNYRSYRRKIQRRIAQAGEAIGMARVCPMVFRTSFITAMAKANVNPYQMAALAGHSNMNTTMKYVRVSEEIKYQLLKGTFDARKEEE